MIKTDICVIGGGSGGLSLAAGAVQMGARVVLVERAKMGGDCLNYGCVPSKSLLAAAHAADTDHAEAMGVKLTGKVNFAAVSKHVQKVINAIAPHDSVERFTELGVKVIKAKARCVDAHTIQAGKETIRAKYIVFATGSSAMTPPIPGVDKIKYFTNETIFANATLPQHLLVIGGGPIGMEMAYAHARLGSKVTLLERFSIMPRDDAELVEKIRERAAGLGIRMVENCEIVSVGKTAKGVSIKYAVNGGKQTSVSGSHLLIAAGRKPNLEGLDLEKAGVEYTPRGIEVDKRLRTSRKHIYAIGDVAGGPQFTHVAGYHAGIVIRNILFKLPARVDYAALPWVTYTDPELAHVGLNWKQACEALGEDNLRLLSFSFSDNDRAQAERRTEGKVKVIAGKKGSILGVDMLGPRAGELIQPWCLAISSGLKMKHMAGYIAPYPTMGEINKRVAGSYYTDALFSNRTKRLVRLLLMV